MKLYLLGFLSSILLTVGAYFVAMPGELARTAVVLIIAAFSLAQILLQFVSFLRIGQEPAPEGEEGPILNMFFHENGVFFLFTILIALTIVIGSIWIMYNLNYRM
jgi:cytochrome o ubiquinol oxidase operon protein cyoD